LDIQGVLLQDFSLEDPDLEADGTVRRLGTRRCIINVGAQRLQGNTAIARLFNAGDFRTTEAAAAGDLDALSTQTHGGRDGLLHRATESDALLELTGDVLADELGVDFGTLDFADVDVDLLAGEMLHLAPQTLNLFTLLADHHTGTGGEQIDGHLTHRALNGHVGKAGMRQTLAQVAADHHVLIEEVTEVLFRVPARIPGLDDAKTEPDRMCFLSHSLPPLVRHHDGEMTKLLFDPESTPLGAR